jgi:hypothetical protein
MRFYVYELVSADGAVQYVGKGSGTRLRAQMRNFGLFGYEVARFKRESDAYAFEREHIADVQPVLNRCAGGNGSRATPARKPVKAAWEKEMDRIGTRCYAARLLLRFASHLVDPSKLDAIRQVAHG